MAKSVLLNVGKYLLGIILLGYVISQYWTPAPGSAGPGLAEALQRPVQVGPLLLAGLLCTVSVLLTFVRWYVLVRAQELPFRFTDALRLGLLGYFLNTFLPGSIGGDLAKIYFLAKEQSRRTVAVSTVILDRALGLLGLVWLVALVGSVFWLGGDETLRVDHSLVTRFGTLTGTLSALVAAAVATVGLSLCGWVVLGILPQWRADRFAGRLERIPKVGSAAAEGWRAVWMYRCRGGSVALALFIAVVGHVGFVLTFYFAAQVFQARDGVDQLPSLAEHFVLVPIGMTIQAFIPTPGGVGGGEALFAGLYQMVDKPGANAVLGSLAQRVLTWVIGLSGYLCYLRMKEPTARGERQLSVVASGERQLPVSAS